MMDIPYENAVRVVAEAAGITEKEVEKRVDEKLKALSGLISKEGAIHIVANELEVQLVQAPSQKEIKVKEISLGSRGITVMGKVVQKWDVKEFDKNGRQGKVASLLLGDDTGVTRLVFWNDQVDAFNDLKVGDVLVVRNPFVKQSYKSDRLELQLNDQSTLQVNPDGIVVPDRPQREERPRLQRYIKDLQAGEENVELIATIVQVYDPRFYDACTQCRKKMIDGKCPEHGEVPSEVNFSMSAVLDDGSDNIRTSFWKQQALVLTKLSIDEFLKVKEDPSAFEEMKTSLAGEIIKVVGSARKNDQQDRMEFTAQLVFTDVDPEQEIANLEKKMAEDRKEKAEEKAPASTGRDDVQEDIISLDDLE